jgi:hypothetical protein
METDCTGGGPPEQDDVDALEALLANAARFAPESGVTEYQTPSGVYLGVAGTIVLTRLPHGVTSEQWLEDAFAACQQRKMMAAAQLAIASMLTLN